MITTNIDNLIKYIFNVKINNNENELLFVRFLESYSDALYTQRNYGDIIDDSNFDIINNTIDHSFFSFCLCVIISNYLFDIYDNIQNQAEKVDFKLFIDNVKSIPNMTDTEIDNILNKITEDGNKELFKLYMNIINKFDKYILKNSKKNIIRNISSYDHYLREINNKLNANYIGQQLVAN